MKLTAKEKVNILSNSEEMKRAIMLLIATMHDAKISKYIRYTYICEDGNEYEFQFTRIPKRKRKQLKAL